MQSLRRRALLAEQYLTMVPTRLSPPSLTRSSTAVVMRESGIPACIAHAVKAYRSMRIPTAANASQPWRWPQ